MLMFLERLRHCLRSQYSRATADVAREPDSMPRRQFAFMRSCFPAEPGDTPMTASAAVFAILVALLLGAIDPRSELRAGRAQRDQPVAARRSRHRARNGRRRDLLWQHRARRTLYVARRRRVALHCAEGRGRRLSHLHRVENLAGCVAADVRRRRHGDAHAQCKQIVLDRPRRRNSAIRRRRSGTEASSLHCCRSIRRCGAISCCLRWCSR